LGVDVWLEPLETNELIVKILKRSRLRDEQDGVACRATGTGWLAREGKVPPKKVIPSDEGRAENDKGW